jgi:hypothetical protein
MHAKWSSESFKERKQLGDLGIDGDSIKMHLKEIGY